MAHVHCPKCDTRLHLPSIQNKQRVRCPACKHEFIVSPPSQPPPLPVNHTGNSYTAPQPENIPPQQPQSTHRVYGGIRRLPYWGITIGLALIQIIIISLVVVGTTYRGMGPRSDVLAITLVFILITFVPVLCRLKNIGMNPWWCCLILVPIASLFVGIPCLVFQEGYADTKKLDTAGKVIACILGFLILGLPLAAIIIWNIL